MTEQPILSVTELSLSLKGVVEQVFEHVRVRGEVSGVKRAASGHIYFSLKDTDSVLSAIVWRGKSKSTSDAIQEGLEIIATGKISTYPGRSSYQMIVETAEPAGEGALLKLLKDRKEKLEKEGLFDAVRKKPIPFLPSTIAVITSPTGAVIRDIMHRLNDRFPVRVILYPVLVQGEGAADQITAAIENINAIPPDGLSINPETIIPHPDLIIVARGGGSLEDLWCFNEESVVRAAANSQIPLISAVGHEIDTTLIDYVADVRAPTPTGAAEIAVPVRSELLLKINKLDSRLQEGTYRSITDKDNQIKMLSRAIPNLGDLVNVFIEKLDDRTERLNNGFKGYMQNIIQKFSGLERLLQSFSFQEILKRGFALIYNPTHQLMTSADMAGQESSLTIQFQDGNLTVSNNSNNPISSNNSNSCVEKQNKKNNPSRASANKKSAKNTHQMDLFHAK